MPPHDDAFRRRPGSGEDESDPAHIVMVTMIAMTRAEYLAAVDAARAAGAAYYDTDVQAMSDAAYDELIGLITATELAHPDWAASDGLLTQFAGGTSSGGDVTHPTPMRSLDNVTDDKPGEGHGALTAFIASINEPVVVEPKLDGMAVRAVYRDGRLVQVVTRGAGQSGEDVTAQARTISGLPARINPSVDMGGPRSTLQPERRIPSCRGHQGRRSVATLTVSPARRMRQARLDTTLGSSEHPSTKTPPLCMVTGNLLDHAEVPEN